MLLIWSEMVAAEPVLKVTGRRRILRVDARENSFAAATRRAARRLRIYGFVILFFFVRNWREFPSSISLINISGLVCQS